VTLTVVHGVWPSVIVVTVVLRKFSCAMLAREIVNGGDAAVISASMIKGAPEVVVDIVIGPPEMFSTVSVPVREFGALLSYRLPD
jgi:hypothetical protein